MEIVEALIGLMGVSLVFCVIAARVETFVRDRRPAVMTTKPMADREPVPAPTEPVPWWGRAFFVVKVVGIVAGYALCILLAAPFGVVLWEIVGVLWLWRRLFGAPTPTPRPADGGVQGDDAAGDISILGREHE